MRTYRFPARLVASVLLAGALLAGEALADPYGPEGASSRPTQSEAAITAHRATLADLRARLDASDQLAALVALHFALSQLGDGSTYVWRKSSRDLSGAIRPTMAFRNESGQICRHVIYVLALGSYSKSIEGIACRDWSGRWTLTG